MNNRRNSFDRLTAMPEKPIAEMTKKEVARWGLYIAFFRSKDWKASREKFQEMSEKIDRLAGQALDVIGGSDSLKARRTMDNLALLLAPYIGRCLLTKSTVHARNKLPRFSNNDVSQEILIKIWTEGRVGQLWPSRKNFLSFLENVSRYTAVDVYRKIYNAKRDKGDKKKSLSEKEMTRLTGDVVNFSDIPFESNAFSSPQPTVEEIVLFRESARLFFRRVGYRGHPRETIAKLLIVDEFTQKEIAASLGVTEARISQLMHYLRKAAIMSGFEKLSTRPERSRPSRSVRVGESTSCPRMA